MKKIIQTMGRVASSVFIAIALILLAVMFITIFYQDHCGSLRASAPDWLRASQEPLMWGILIFLPTALLLLAIDKLRSYRPWRVRL